MSKRVYKYFYGFLDAQQHFLNRMSSQGWRLIKTGKLSYDFEPCEKNAYQYCIDFVAPKSSSTSRDYQQFLEDMGYRVMTKPVNVNWSIGKVRLRPWGDGRGKFSTNPGTFNNELFIVEKKNDGTPFQLHTTSEDKLSYYRSMFFVWMTITALLLFLTLSSGYWPKTAVAAVLAAVHGWVTLRHYLKARQLKRDIKVTE
jgi:hypothetical protein